MKQPGHSLSSISLPQKGGKAKGGLCSCEIAGGVNDDTMDPSDPSITLLKETDLKTPRI